MTQRMYRELATWYRLLTPLADYEEEAAAFRAALACRAGSSLLELGCGAGHVAWHLRSAFPRMVLSDLSPDMLALSREIHPEVEHVAGDMRALRLGRTFDAVLVHDAVTYMTTEGDLASAIATTWAHLRPGGLAVFAPDYLRETFEPGHDTGGSDSADGTRGLRYLDWVHDPDPTDTTYLVDYAFMLRTGSEVVVEHERHVEGLFPRATWHRLFADAGFEVSTGERPNGDGTADEFFVLRRP